MWSFALYFKVSSNLQRYLFFNSPSIPTSHFQHAIPWMLQFPSTLGADEGHLLVEGSSAVALYVLKLHQRILCPHLLATFVAMQHIHKHSRSLMPFKRFMTLRTFYYIQATHCDSTKRNNNFVPIFWTCSDRMRSSRRETPASVRARWCRGWCRCICIRPTQSNSRMS